MDARRALRDAVWYRLTGDPGLQALFEPLDIRYQVFPVWAAPDSPLPYIVHRFQHNRSDTIFKDGSWYLDIWDYSPTVDRIHNIAQRVIDVMEGAILGVVNGEFVWAENGKELPNGFVLVGRFSLATDGDVPEDTKDIWHYATVWNVRWNLQPSEIERLLQ